MRELSALVVNQWVHPDWDKVEFTPAPPREKPEDHFYVFSISAYDLRRLSGVYRRDPSKPPAEDAGIQRRHVPERSREILRYLKDGFPLSRIPRNRLVDPTEADSLRMPGWLPTAIVANILTSQDKRGPKRSQVEAAHLVKVERVAGQATAKITLPEHYHDDSWLPKVHPIEIIDGQHRLWALGEDDETER